jgi:hypothetical protein
VTASNEVDAACEQFDRSYPVDTTGLRRRTTEPVALEIHGAQLEVLLGSRFPHRRQNERLDHLPDEIGIDGLSTYDAQQAHCQNHVGDQ